MGKKLSKKQSLFIAYVYLALVLIFLAVVLIVRASDYQYDPAALRQELLLSGGGSVTESIASGNITAYLKKTADKTEFIAVRKMHFFDRYDVLWQGEATGEKSFVSGSDDILLTTFSFTDSAIEIELTKYVWLENFLRFAVPFAACTAFSLFLRYWRKKEEEIGHEASYEELRRREYD